MTAINPSSRKKPREFTLKCSNCKKEFSFKEGQVFIDCPTHLGVAYHSDSYIHLFCPYCKMELYFQMGTFFEDEPT
jgi:hypothetical protein